MRIIFVLLIGMLVATSIQAAPATAPAKVATTQEAPWVNLWPGRAPHAIGDEKSDTPALQIFTPIAGTASGSAIVVCPGGGYGGLAPHEGGKVGQWLAENGVT